MKRKKYIKEMARRIIELNMGDKIDLGTNKEAENNKDKIEINNENTKQTIIKAPLYTKMYNAFLTALIIAAFIIGFVMPLIIVSKYTIEFTGDMYLSGQLLTLGTFIKAIPPLLRFYAINFLFTLIVASITILIVIILFIIKHVCAVIEYKILEKSIKKNSDKIQDKLKELDKTEESMAK
jgi:hypothetical protein